jgi:hypothetical protein
MCRYAAFLSVTDEHDVGQGTHCVSQRAMLTVAADGRTRVQHKRYQAPALADEQQLKEGN